ncbi:unnamed protein product [Anisakis simplex]|uniref:NAM-associated domain-containing protein n=1 Tax=Anisakis simplex TaxID=6269 RepID=A0A0M3KF65_ANISI|nr:unnamed protein product [Anisakis simplex]
MAFCRAHFIRLVHLQASKERLLDKLLSVRDTQVDDRDEKESSAANSAEKLKGHSTKRASAEQTPSEPKADGNAEELKVNETNLQICQTQDSAKRFKENKLITPKDWSNKKIAECATQHTKEDDANRVDDIENNGKEETAKNGKKAMVYKEASPILHTALLKFKKLADKSSRMMARDKKEEGSTDPTPGTPSHEGSSGAIPSSELSAKG